MSKSRKTDSWTFGTILLHVLTGEVPWDGSDGPTILDELSKQASAPADGRWTTSPPTRRALKDLIEDCLKGNGLSADRQGHHGKT